MEDSDEDSPVYSDSEDSVTCRDESPSSGFVDDTEESFSLRSESTSSSITAKPKKRVTFESDDNLVLIREIPRRCKSKTDSEFSDSDSDEIDVDCALRDDVFYSSATSCMAKGRYEVKKSSGRTAAKIAAITGASLMDTRNRLGNARNAAKKKTGRREKRKKVTSDTPEVSETNKTPKQKQNKEKQPKKIPAKKPEGKSVSKPKVNKSKDEKNTNNISLEIEIKSHEISVKTHCDNCNKQCEENCSYASQTSTTKRLSELFHKDDETTSALKTLQKVCMVENEFLTINKNNGLQCSERLDVKSMSKTNRRLYSWLMANGNIPNPQHQTPSIAPMWETS